MTVKLCTDIHRYIGVSTDTKPTTGVPAGSVFYETNTANTYVYNGSSWVQVVGCYDGGIA
jgi:hypothetical protein